MSFLAIVFFSLVEILEKKPMIVKLKPTGSHKIWNLLHDNLTTNIYFFTKTYKNISFILHVEILRKIPCCLSWDRGHILRCSEWKSYIDNDSKFQRLNWKKIKTSKIKERCYIQNIFTINHRWLVFIGSNLIMERKLMGI